MAYLSLKFSEEVNVPRLEGAASIAPFNIFVSGTSFCCNNIRSALPVWPDKNRQMSVKVAQIWFN